MALSANMNVMIKAAEKAARSLLRDFGEVEQLQVSKKGPGDFVSAADKRAEEIIYEDLLKARPDYGFIMEESGEVKGNNSDFKWIIDPLDGTTNFLHGVPHWCISIALEEKGEIIAGLIFDPIKDDSFRAEKGSGAFVKNKRLRVSSRTVLEESLITTGAPKRARESHAQFIAEYEAVQDKIPGLRRFGAAALDLAYVAAGRFEGFWERDLHSWDIAAGCIIVKEAGGIITDIDGRGNPVHRGSVIAGNPTIHEDLRTLIRNANASKDAA